jgi:REP element-mobilizing transposase RayT
MWVYRKIFFYFSPFFMSVFAHRTRSVYVVKLRRWEFPGNMYHVTFTARHKSPILNGSHADYIAAEILALDEIDGCIVAAWCIMPEHVHMLVFPPDGKISSIVKRVKGRTGKRLKKYHPELDRFWDQRYCDRRLRAEDQVDTTIEYIENNPVRRGLCAEASQWRWSSAYVREHGNDCFEIIETF